MQLLIMLPYMGIVLMILGVSMALPIFWGIYFNESEWVMFLLSSIITFSVGLIMNKATTRFKEDLRQRQALILVTLTWIVASVFSTIPYLLTKTFDTFTDAFFESMAGFTTTGASVIPDLEVLSYTVLFWRSLTHWLGGMGIIILFIAIMSTLKMGGTQLFRAEIPGSVVQKLKPRISQTALILWSTYVILTFVLTAILWALGMSIFDAINHAFGTMATAGCSTKNASLGYYNDPGIYWAVTIFMFLAGSNFALYFVALKEKSLLHFWKNAEFRLYTKIVVLFTFMMTTNLLFIENKSIADALTLSSFKVISSITTTGFTIYDYQGWTAFPQTIIIVLLFVGGCNGSTSGSIKVGRYLIMFKQCIVELQQAVHPRAIINLKLDGKQINDQLIINVLTYFFLYIFLISMGTLFLTFLGLDLLSAFTAVLGSISNGGIGLTQLASGQFFTVFPTLGKHILALLMLLGRLEIYTVLILFSPGFWRK